MLLRLHIIQLPLTNIYRIIFWGNSSNITEVFLLQKRKIRIRTTVSSRCSCRGVFITLDILPVPSEYTFSSMMFAIISLDNFPANFDVHGVNTRAKHQLYRTTVNLSCIQKGVFYSSIKIFNSLPPRVLKLKQENQNFGQL
jgi:hypothetical protein